MANLNRVMIIGNLSKDVEVRYMPNGNAAASFSVATNESWKDKQTGEKKENVEFHKIAMFGKLAEIAGNYLKKGSKVYLSGKLQTRKWQNQQGQDQYTTEIVANEMQMLDSRGQGGMQQSGGFQQQAPQHQQGGFQQQTPKQQGGFANQGQQQNQAAPKVNPQESIIDFDDTPFAPIGLEHNNMFIYCI